MEETFSPAALRAYVRAKGRYADLLTARARAKLGVPVESRPARSVRGGTAMSGRPVNLRTLNQQDARSIRRLLKVWTRIRLRHDDGRTPVTLASGREVLFDHGRKEFLEP